MSRALADDAELERSFSSTETSERPRLRKFALVKLRDVPGRGVRAPFHVVGQRRGAIRRSNDARARSGARAKETICSFGITQVGVDRQLQHRCRLRRL